LLCLLTSILCVRFDRSILIGLANYDLKIDRWIELDRCSLDSARWWNVFFCFLWELKSSHAIVFHQTKLWWSSSFNPISLFRWSCWEMWNDERSAYMESYQQSEISTSRSLISWSILRW
jgi:hypothetical protein